MIDEHILNRKSIKYYVRKYLLQNKELLKDKIAIDIPAGNGATSEILYEIGCKTEPYDLFPEYFIFPELTCQRANITDKIPVGDSYADMIICQEGLEHFSDQAKVFKEFNRALKKGGMLLLTTPSYSNLKAKISYLLFETEYYHKMMPPNEIDSVWMADDKLSDDMYYGHIFLSGIQKIRVLGKLSGFDIKRVIFTRVNKTSLILFPFLYPFIFITSYITYFRSLNKNKSISIEVKKKVYKEILRLNINPKILIDAQTFIEFEKVSDPKQVKHELASIFKPFGEIM